MGGEVDAQQAEGVVHLTQGLMVPTIIPSSGHGIIFDFVRGRLSVRLHKDQLVVDRCRDNEHRREPTKSVVKAVKTLLPLSAPVPMLFHQSYRHGAPS